VSLLWRRVLVAWALLLLLPCARAAITCTSVTSPGVSINYQTNTTASVQGFFTVSCTRTSAGDPGSVSYEVTADNGLYRQGQVNRAALGTARLNYDLYTNSGCTTEWRANQPISDTISWAPGSTGTVTKQASFWACVPAQSPTSSGGYTDQVGLTLTYNNTTLAGTVGVTIFAPAYCLLLAAPADLILSYAAFGPQVAQSTTFRTRCTNGMPYTISTDVVEGVLSGVRYVLSLSDTSPNGTGQSQTFTLTATAPANQAGQCPTGACTGTRVHTLTISY
jgi:spore coat protein U-like protein